MHQTTLERYIPIWDTVRQLKNMGSDAPIEGSSASPGVIDLLYDMEFELSQQTSDSHQDVVFQPFSEVQAFHKEFEEFAEVLADPKIETLGTYRKDLHKMLKRFGEAFNKVLRKKLFISVAPKSHNQYLTLTHFSDRDWLRFHHLPRLAQTNFRDAGKCLAYGLYGAALGLSLQAVEATLRFYYHRHGGVSDPERGSGWGKILTYLENGYLPDPELCFPPLERLQKHYRNTIAHGRANFEAGVQEASAAEAKHVFDDCWGAVHPLFADISSRPQLSIKITTHSDLQLDTAVAVYLFTWNPELPDAQFDFKNTVSTDEIVDETLVRPNPQRPGENLEGKTLIPEPLTPDCKYFESPHPSLSNAVLKHLQVQSSYAQTLETLLTFVAEHRNGVIQSNFNPHNPREKDVTLADLFTGIKKQNSNDRDLILTESWDLLDKFLAIPGLQPDDPQLVTKLGKEDVFAALYEED